MRELTSGLIYSPDLNKLIYSNEFLVNSGLNLQSVYDKLGNYAEYISEDDRDLLYAKSMNIEIFNELPKNFDYTLLNEINLDEAIISLIKLYPQFETNILDEYEFVLRNDHNILLLKMAFILKNHLNKFKTNVYLMRGSGISSFLLYVMDLNKVNPCIFGLDYKDFWKE